MSWSGDLLQVSHLPLGRAVWVGDDAAGEVAATLPCDRRRLVEGEHLAIDAFDLSLHRVELEPMRRSLSFGSRLVPAWLASAAVHAGVVFALAAFPAASLDDALAVDAESKSFLVEHESRRSSRVAPRDSASGNDLGAAHAHAKGTLGTNDVRPAEKHFAVEGPRETPELKLRDAYHRIEVGAYGALAALTALSNAKIGPFDGDADATLGVDPTSAVGHLFGRSTGDAEGSGGFGLARSGIGGAGAFSGIGLDESGIFGGCGCGIGGLGAMVFAQGQLVPPRAFRHRTRPAPKILEGGEALGSLSKEAITRVLHAQVHRFGGNCYESGLKRDPSLAGTVGIRFIIDSLGAVEVANVVGGTLADVQVRSCVRAVFADLSFPQPESGKVFGTFAIEFQPE